MKLSNLMIASLGAVALMGCDDGDKTPAPAPTPDPTVYSVENTVWDIKTAGTASGLSTTAIADIVAYHFDSDSDKVKIYETAYYTTSGYSIEGNESDTDIGEVSFEYENQKVTCDFNSANKTLELSNCSAAGFDVSGAAGYEPGSDQANDLIGDIDEKPSTDAEGKSVLIKDTSAGDTAGQLSHKLDSELSAGKVSFNVLFDGDEEQTFYATLYDNTGKTDASAVDIGLKKSGAIQIRQYDGEGDWNLVTLPDVEFTPDKWVNFAITWDANTSEFNLTVDEQNLGAFDFNNAGVNVASVGFKIGTNDNVTNTEFPVYIDDFNIYSDTTGEAVVLEDNFDAYDTNYAFDSDTSKYTSNEATVSSNENATQDDGSEPTDPESVTDNFDYYTVGAQIDAASSAYKTTANGETTFAEISSDFASSVTNSLKISDTDITTKPVVSRAFTGNTESGSVSLKVYIPSAGYEKATYVYLGSSESASSSGRFTEIVFTSDTIKFRDHEAEQVDLAGYEQNTWVDVTISWESKNEDGKYPVAVSINGDEYTQASGVDMIAEALTGAPSLMALYVGDTKAEATYSYFDDLDSELF